MSTTQRFFNGAAGRSARRPVRVRRGLGTPGTRTGSGWRRRPTASSALAWLAVVVLAIAVAGVLAWWEQRPLEVPDGFSEDAVVAEMVRVVDGDTIVVSMEGEDERVRLLNIDTPETVHPTEPVECGGPEASAAISQLLSPGDVIVLEFDQQLRDRYDRLLAAVFVEDVFVNERMAREGWGEPAYYAPNDRFLAVVEQAWAQAREENAGVFSPQLVC
ncbi:thermonuclease family protein [Nesterenkonia haasae]|uniref:thermonuclease family protein n=1 Tax=Nesterenkonia haasae TaxID=2587813 RepID=UPI001F363151|nr:thermonuclease family protein [Nesterenkonia haasae]